VVIIALYSSDLDIFARATGMGTDTPSFTAGEHGETSANCMIVSLNPATSVASLN
jgi:hypothetical protein